MTLKANTTFSVLFCVVDAIFAGVVAAQGSFCFRQASMLTSFICARQRVYFVFIPWRPSLFISARYLSITLLLAFSSLVGLAGHTRAEGLHSQACPRKPSACVLFVLGLFSIRAQACIGVSRWIRNLAT
jgi:hypothetical protein